MRARYRAYRPLARATWRLLAACCPAYSFTLPGVTGADGQPVTATALRAIVTPGYAEALGRRLKEGRLFRTDDTTSAIRSILVNEAFAKTYLTDGRPATGRRFIGLFPAWLGKDVVVEVVGVVQDVLPAALDARPQPQILSHREGACTSVRGRSS